MLIAASLALVACSAHAGPELSGLWDGTAFLHKYGIEYTYLVAGEPSELEEKIPQAVNLNSWPTTFFIGRDGKVRAIHAGFAAAASGPDNAALKKEVTERVERLLSEDIRASR